MDQLRIVRPVGDEMLDHWRHVHNTIIPTHLLSLADVRERAGRHHLDVAYLGDVPVGNTTVRPPDENPDAAVVIARVLPEHRGHGHGRTLYEHALTTARAMGVTQVETVVLETNASGLAFALARGFEEFDRYVLDGDELAYVELRRSLP
ncbi:GNAT family N-acetyltransferase [Streptomyces sp. NPDC086023]|uniref:GNAT family N-acetyltransferase n=1 Tax=Streptomyces sp. NPDC086023 TaxID=3365746 RepID=UPI0037D3A33E